MVERYEPKRDDDELQRIHCPVCRKLVCKIYPVPGMTVEVKCKCGILVRHTVPKAKQLI